MVTHHPYDVTWSLCLGLHDTHIPTGDVCGAAVPDAYKTRKVCTRKLSSLIFEGI